MLLYDVELVAFHIAVFVPIIQEFEFISAFTIPGRNTTMRTEKNYLLQLITTITPIAIVL